MNDNLPIHTRTLPLYLAGVAVGQDIGLRLALEVIVAEAERQRDLAILVSVAHFRRSDSFAAAAKHEFTAARLSDVASVVAAYFRATH
jgi:hypothetical protein